MTIVIKGRILIYIRIHISCRFYYVCYPVSLQSLAFKCRWAWKWIRPNKRFALCTTQSSDTWGAFQKRVWALQTQTQTQNISFNSNNHICKYKVKTETPLGLFAFYSWKIFINVYLRNFKISMLYKNHIFQYMGQTFCVEFQRVPLKFHTKYLTHTLKYVDFIHRWIFKSS